jgi:hypothetical protein
MSEPIHSRSVAEHLCTLATLLEAEAMKATALGIHPEKRLGSEARHIRELSNRLWEANTMIRLEYGDQASDTAPGTQVAADASSDVDETMQSVHGQPGRRGRRNQMKLVSS